MASILHLNPFETIDLRDKQVASEALGKLLDEEQRRKEQARRTGNSRHSRFGTTIMMKAVRNA